MERTKDHGWLASLVWFGAGILSGGAWYGMVKLATWVLRLQGVHMVSQ